MIGQDGEVSMRDQLLRETNEDDDLHKQMAELDDIFPIEMENLKISNEEADDNRIRRFPVAGDIIKD